MLQMLFCFFTRLNERQGGEGDSAQQSAKESKRSAHNGANDGADHRDLFAELCTGFGAFYSAVDGFGQGVENGFLNLLIVILLRVVFDPN